MSSCSSVSYQDDRTPSYPDERELIPTGLSLNSFTHLFKEIGNHNRNQDEVKNAHSGSTTEIGKLDRGEIGHDTKKLRTRARAAAGERVGQTEGLHPFNYPGQYRDR
jgi:hypothetical protein